MYSCCLLYNLEFRNFSFSPPNLKRGHFTKSRIDAIPKSICAKVNGTHSPRIWTRLAHSTTCTYSYHTQNSSLQPGIIFAKRSTNVRIRLPRWPYLKMPWTLTFEMLISKAAFQTNFFQSRLKVSIALSLFVRETCVCNAVFRDIACGHLKTSVLLQTYHWCKQWRVVLVDFLETLF